MATKKRLMGYDPITLESFTQHMTKHREPYDQCDMGYVDAFEQIENWLEYNTVDAVEEVHSEWVWIPVAGVTKFRCGNIDCCRLIPFGCSPAELKYCPNCGAKMDMEVYK